VAWQPTRWALLEFFKTGELILSGSLAPLVPAGRRPF
jgi:hypothetical protein